MGISQENYVSMDLWVRQHQLDRWTKDAEKMEMSLYEYIRNSVDRYYYSKHPGEGIFDKQKKI